MGSPRHVEPQSCTLVRPVESGGEWVQLEPLRIRATGTPLHAGQYINIGGELRIILEVGEGVVRVAGIDENHSVTEYVYRPAQDEIDTGWYRRRHE